MEKLYDMFQQPVNTSVGTVELVFDEHKRTTGRWTFKCRQV